MKPIHVAAVAVIAMCGLGLSTPAEAAPKGGPSVSATTGAVVQIDHRDRDDWRRERRGDRTERWDDDRDRDWRRHRDRGDWDRHEHRRFGWDRGRHLGWDRGRGHKWHHGKGDGHDWRWGKRRGDDRRWGRDHRRWDRDDWRDRKDWKKARKRWEKAQKRWHARKHPRHRHWVGRPFRHDRFSVLRDHRSFQLPPPWRGQFYAQNNQGVFLIDEATRQIIDAYILYNVLGR